MRSPISCSTAAFRILTATLRTGGRGAVARPTSPGHRAGAQQQRSDRRADARSHRADAPGRHVRRVIERLIERMQKEDYISVTTRARTRRARRASAGRSARPGAGEIRDHRQKPGLPRLPHAARPARLARQVELRPHDTRDLATGIETSGASKPYEFGDVLNLDITETLSRAIQREGCTCRSTSSTPTCRCISASTSPPAPRC